ncbi:hypothetical protein EUGRSUZ_G02285 [Eucalyptus grandis]|uniref:Uncharacterized protein n=1 Tax=Eucalyptus grandis TaxID=71139 RepID=A0ACC3K582_EUCGR|nr:hypothetical protein EUGRSUZ_G02285 [Eucalyptus grandis]
MTTSIKSCYFLSSESICIGSSNKTCSASTKRLAFAPKIGKLFSYFLQKLPHRLLEEQLIALLQSCRTKKQLYQIHAQVVCHGLERNHYVAPKIITTCAQLKEMGHAHKAFDHILDPNVSLWNAMQGYSQNELNREVVRLLGALDLGKWVQVYAESHGYGGNTYVVNALIDMYAKCGTVENALYVFVNMSTKDLISWNTVINGLAIHGRGADALSLFEQMKRAGVKPDGITFIGVLCACTHMGMVADGFSHFQSMIDDYSLVPRMEHYGCMVDLLARAGLLVQAVEFVNKMPVKADAVIWATLLGACRLHKNVDLAEVALHQLNELEPGNPTNYVTLSNIYKDVGKWKDVARLKAAMKDTGRRKLPGCSLIEVNDDIVQFYSLDERHPDSDEIYEALDGLIKLSRSSGYESDLTSFEQ